MPIGSSIGQPGERVTRFAGAKEDIIHILYAAACAIPACLLVLAGLYAICAIHGLIVGYYLGFVGIFLIHNPIARWARKTKVEGKIFTVVIGFVLVVVAWGMAGQRVLSTIGWPDPLPWSGWWKFWATVGIIVTEVAVIAAAYALLTETLDPSYPPPRKAISRDTPLRPWTKETYDGRTLFPTVPPAPPEPETVYRRIEVHSTRSNGQTKISRDVPDTGAWWDFLRAIVEEGKSFSEPEAKRHKARGYRRVRMDLMANEKEWIRWHNAENHLEGIEVTPEGMQVFAGIVEAGRPSN